MGRAAGQFQQAFDASRRLGTQLHLVEGHRQWPQSQFRADSARYLCFSRERAVSADYVKHRFVGDATLEGPTHINPIVNGWQLGMIVSLETPHYFTKFAGFDSNGDIFGNNDRVGIEPRNTFQGDGYQSVDMRVSRTFKLTEKVHLEALAEALTC